MTQLAGQPASPEAQAAKLRGILESAVTAIITIDDAGLIESINPATERLFGYAAAELIGQNVKMLMPEPYEAEHDGYITNYLESRANTCSSRSRIRVRGCQRISAIACSSRSSRQKRKAVAPVSD
jgi:PAS domain S-box-containing protein